MERQYGYEITDGYSVIGDNGDRKFSSKIEAYSDAVSYIMDMLDDELPDNRVVDTITINIYEEN